MRWVLFLFAATLAAAPAPPLPEDPAARALIERFRAEIAEVTELDDRFHGGLSGLSGGSLIDLGKINFIVSQTWPLPRAYLHQDDHNFVFSAVRGQDPAELEANLPAIANYVKLAAASRIYLRNALRKEPMVGPRKGLEKVREIAERAHLFRESHVAMIKKRQFRPSRVLTPGNLGELGDPALLAELNSAFQAGEDQFSAQRNSVAFLVAGVQLAIGCIVAAVFLRKSKPFNVLRSLRAASSEAG